MNRCKWVNEKNEKYIKYHDNEWGMPSHDDKYLFEMLLLESFQAGLSWECILNKRENFRKAFDNFDYNIIANYNEDKIKELKQNEGIIRNTLKIKAAINNAKIYIKIIKEYNSFNEYIWHFTNGKVIKNNGSLITNELSDKISNDLIKKGMKFTGSKIIYSYLEAIGMQNNHEKDCFKNND